MTRYPCSGCGLWECEGECFLASAADYPKLPEEAPAPRAKYVPSPEYLAWCEKVDRDPLKHLEPKSGDPLLEKRDRRVA